MGNQIFGFIGYYSYTNLVSTVAIEYISNGSGDSFTFDDITIIDQFCLDTDNDGISNHLDIDSDDDGDGLIDYDDPDCENIGGAIGIDNN